MGDVPMDDGDFDGLIQDRRPVQVALGLIAKARRDPEYSDVPLDHFVTRESLARWDLDELAAMLEGYGVVVGGVVPRTPLVAEVRFVETDAERPFILREPRMVMSISFYLKFVDELKDWRVHAAATPNLPVEELP